MGLYTYDSTPIPKSDRIPKLVENLYAKMPEIESARAVLITESYKQTENEPMIIRRAKAFQHILENIPITIRDLELVVGSSTLAPRGCQTFPEFSYEWLEAEFDTVETRSADPFYISEQTKKELKEANAQLKKDIDEKVQIDEMRKEFIANVSHELKTPIALIQGYAEGLKECINDDPESREFYCEVIMDESSKMNQMVKKLLTLNQLEFGDEKIQFERFDLTELVKGVLQSMELFAEQKQAKVRFRQTEPLYVWGDEYKIEQVVRNYVSNAFNHLAGDMVVEVKIEVKDGIARTTVFNTGKPIPEEDISHIWEKFYKVDKAHTREYGGNGIGLSIVKAIMESLHRKYGVENYDNGVAFWFELEVK